MSASATRPVGLLLQSAKKHAHDRRVGDVMPLASVDVAVLAPIVGPAKPRNGPPRHANDYLHTLAAALRRARRSNGTAR